MIEQVTAGTLDPTLGNSVLPGACERSPDGSDPQGADRCGKLDTILPIPVKDQELGSRVERKRFPQLLKNPSTGGMTRDVRVQDATTIMADHEESIEHAEADGRNVKKSIAAIASRWLRRKASHGFAGCGSLGTRLIHREMVRSEMSKPSMSNSPWTEARPKSGSREPAEKSNDAFPSIFASCPQLGVPWRSLANRAQIQCGASESRFLG